MIVAYQYICYTVYMVEVSDKVFQMRVSEEFLRRLDDWRRGQPDLPARAETVRRLVEAGLGRVGVRTLDDYKRSRDLLIRQIEMLQTGIMSPTSAPAKVEDDILEAMRQVSVLDEALTILTKGASDALASNHELTDESSGESGVKLKRQPE